MKKIAISLSLVASLYGNTFIDKDTGLMWQDNEEVKNNERNWENAISYCNNLALDGYSDWRLPNIDELLTITDDKKFNPAIKAGLKNVRTDDYYWTSSLGYHNSTYICVVNFWLGRVSTNDKDGSDLVRCVRDSTLKFDSFSSLKSALKSNYKDDKQLTQKALEIYYGKPTLSDFKYDPYSSSFSANASVSNSISNKPISWTMTPSEAKDFFNNYNNITPIGVFEVKNDVATLKTIRFENNGKKYNSNFVDKPIEADTIKEFRDSPDGKMYQVITTDNTMYLVDKQTSKVVAVLDAQDADRYNFQTTSVDNNFAMLLDSNNNSYVFLDPKSKKELFRPPNTYNNIGAFTISPNNKFATLVAKDNNSFTLYDIENKKELLTLDGSFEKYQTFTLSPDKHYLSLVGKDNSVKILDLITKKELITLNGNYKDLKSFEFTNENRYLTLHKNDNNFVILDVASNKELVTLSSTTYPNMKLYSVSDDKKYLTITNNDNSKVLLDLKSSKEILTLDSNSPYKDFISLHQSEDKQFIALTRADNSIVFLDGVTRKELFSLTSPIENTTKLVFDELKRTVTLSNVKGDSKTLSLGEYINKQHYLVLLDSSNSMATLDSKTNLSRLELAKKSIIDNIAQLDIDKVMVGLTTVAGSCGTHSSIVPSKTSTKESLESLKTLAPNGEASIASGIDTIAATLQNTKERVNLLVITNGVDSCGGDIEASAKKLLKIPNLDLKLNVVGIDDSLSTKEKLEAISKLNNATYTQATNQEELNNALQTIAKADNIKDTHFSDDGKAYTFQINFATNSNVINSEYNNLINGLATYININKFPVTIEGHTDNVGNPKANKTLSQKRAEAVVKELIKQGVDKKLLKAVGRGSEAPKGDNATQEGRDENRRVEAHFKK